MYILKLSISICSKRNDLWSCSLPAASPEVGLLCNKTQGSSGLNQGRMCVFSVFGTGSGSVRLQEGKANHYYSLYPLQMCVWEVWKGKFGNNIAIQILKCVHLSIPGLQRLHFRLKPSTFITHTAQTFKISQESDDLNHVLIQFH